MFRKWQQRNTINEEALKSSMKQVLKSRHEPGDNTKISIWDFVMKWKSLSRVLYNDYRWRSLVRSISDILLMNSYRKTVDTWGSNPEPFRSTVEHHPNLCATPSPYIHVITDHLKNVVFQVHFSKPLNCIVFIISTVQIRHFTDKLITDNILF